MVTWRGSIDVDVILSNIFQNDPCRREKKDKNKKRKKEKDERKKKTRE